jgi:O-acetylhomoserine (thiol)-lyase
VAAFKKVRGTTGNSLAAQNAFLTLKGVETLSLRMDRHCSNAMAVATYLDQHPAVTVTQYPGLSTHADHAVATRQFGGHYGGMVTLRLGSKARAYAFLNTLTVIQCLVNLGDAKTLAVCPRRTIYRDLTDEQAAEAGVYDDLIRLSVGLESEADLIADLTQALEVL